MPSQFCSDQSWSILFQEVFPVQYGPQYDTALHVLLWEMLTKLENMLPVPDLKQVFGVSPVLCHPPTVITEQAVIADCELARLHPCSGGMYSALT